MGKEIHLEDAPVRLNESLKKYLLPIKMKLRQDFTIALYLSCPMKSSLRSERNPWNFFESYLPTLPMHWPLCR